MDPIAVIKPEMTVARQDILSPFGLLTQLFTEELVRRSAQTMGSYRPLRLAYLEEEEGEAQTAAPEIHFDLNIDLLVNRLLKAEREKEQNEKTKPPEVRILERVILREREIRTAYPETRRLVIETGGRRIETSLPLRKPTTGTTPQTGEKKDAAVQTLRQTGEGRSTGEKDALRRSAGLSPLAPLTPALGRKSAYTPPQRSLTLASQAMSVPAAGGWTPKERELHPGYPTQSAQGQGEGLAAGSILLPDVMRRRREAALARSENPAADLAPQELSLLEDSLAWGTEDTEQTSETERVLRQVRRAVQETLRRNEMRNAPQRSIPAPEPAVAAAPTGRTPAEERRESVPAQSTAPTRPGTAAVRPVSAENVTGAETRRSSGAEAPVYREEGAASPTRQGEARPMAAEGPAYPERSRDGEEHDARTPSKAEYTLRWDRDTASQRAAWSGEAKAPLHPERPRAAEAYAPQASAEESARAVYGETVKEDASVETGGRPGEAIAAPVPIALPGTQETEILPGEELVFRLTEENADAPAGGKTSAETHEDLARMPRPAPVAPKGDAASEERAASGAVTAQERSPVGERTVLRETQVRDREDRRQEAAPSILTPRIPGEADAGVLPPPELILRSEEEEGKPAAPETASASRASRSERESREPGASATGASTVSASSVDGATAAPVPESPSTPVSVPTAQTLRGRESETPQIRRGETPDRLPDTGSPWETQETLRHEEPVRTAKGDAETVSPERPEIKIRPEAEGRESPAAAGESLPQAEEERYALPDRGEAQPTPPPELIFRETEGEEEQAPKEGEASLQRETETRRRVYPAASPQGVTNPNKDDKDAAAPWKTAFLQPSPEEKRAEVSASSAGVFPEEEHTVYRQGSEAAFHGEATEEAAAPALPHRQEPVSSEPTELVYRSEGESGADSENGGPVSPQQRREGPQEELPPRTGRADRPETVQGLTAVPTQPAAMEGTPSAGRELVYREEPEAAQAPAPKGTEPARRPEERERKTGEAAPLQPERPLFQREAVPSPSVRSDLVEAPASVGEPGRERGTPQGKEPDNAAILPSPVQTAAAPAALPGEDGPLPAPSPELIFMEQEASDRPQGSTDTPDPNAGPEGRTPRRAETPVLEPGPLAGRLEETASPETGRAYPQQTPESGTVPESRAEAREASWPAALPGEGELVFPPPAELVYREEAEMPEAAGKTGESRTPPPKTVGAPAARETVLPGETVVKRIVVPAAGEPGAVTAESPSVQAEQPGPAASPGEGYRPEDRRVTPDAPLLVSERESITSGIPRALPGTPDGVAAPSPELVYREEGESPRTPPQAGESQPQGTAGPAGSETVLPGKTAVKQVYIPVPGEPGTEAAESTSPQAKQPGSTAFPIEGYPLEEGSLSEAALLREEDRSPADIPSALPGKPYEEAAPAPELIYREEGEDPEAPSLPEKRQDRSQVTAGANAAERSHPGETAVRRIEVPVKEEPGAAAAESTSARTGQPGSAASPNVEYPPEDRRVSEEPLLRDGERVQTGIPRALPGEPAGVVSPAPELVYREEGESSDMPPRAGEAQDAAQGTALPDRTETVLPGKTAVRRVYVPIAGEPGPAVAESAAAQASRPGQAAPSERAYRSEDRPEAAEAEFREEEQREAGIPTALPGEPVEEAAPSPELIFREEGESPGIPSRAEGEASSRRTEGTPAGPESSPQGETAVRRTEIPIRGASKTPAEGRTEAAPAGKTYAAQRQTGSAALREHERPEFPEKAAYREREASETAIPGALPGVLDTEPASPPELVYRAEIETSEAPAQGGIKPSSRSLPGEPSAPSDRKSAETAAPTGGRNVLPPGETRPEPGDGEGRGQESPSSRRETGSAPLPTGLPARETAPEQTVTETVYREVPVPEGDRAVPVPDGAEREAVSSPALVYREDAEAEPPATQGRGPSENRENAALPLPAVRREGEDQRQPLTLRLHRDPEGQAAHGVRQVARDIRVSADRRTRPAGASALRQEGRWTGGADNGPEAGKAGKSAAEALPTNNAEELPEPPELFFAPQLQTAAEEKPPEAAPRPTERVERGKATDELPAWAKELLEQSGATDTVVQTAAFYGQSPGAASRQITWTAPGAMNPPNRDQTGPAELTFKERSETEQTPYRPPISDEELRRTADRVYRIIEERLRRELRRSGQ